MIKIVDLRQGSCNLHIEVDPTRSNRIWEAGIGLAIANKSSDYVVTKNDDIYKTVNSISLELTLEDLRKMQKKIQEEFSQEIHVMKNKLDDLKLLQKIIKKEEKV